MIEPTLKKECKSVFNYLLKVMNEDQIKELSYILTVIKRNDFPVGRLHGAQQIQAKEEIIPYREISGLKVYTGGKN